jgi:ABC-type Fe3+-hydroxamate transport system substrate-binding protein
MPFITALSVPPQRIISLVPSQTELLFDLGLAERIVGITKFCIHPQAAVKQKTKVGGTKNFRLAEIDRLQPDLVIGNKEENDKKGIEEVARKYPVWISDIANLPDALQMIETAGELTGTVAQATQLSCSIRQQFAELVPVRSYKVAYFIWKNPYMVAGNHTFIHDMLTRCGFVNAFGHLTRYPEVTAEAILEANLDFIFLSSEPYPFAEKHMTEFTSLGAKAVGKVVDGELFSWYGSRLLHSVTYFQSLLREMETLSGSGK